MNAIFIRHYQKIFVKEGSGQISDDVLAAFLENLEPLGLAHSQRLVERIQTLSIEKIERLYKSLVKDLQEIVGAHREFTPMYPNFPNQVIEMSKAQLYFNAIRHYWTNKLPHYETISRPALKEKYELRVIDLGTKEELEQIFTRLVGSKTSISPQNKLDLAWFVTQYRDDISRLLPADVPNKENMAVVGALLVRYTSVADDFLTHQLKNATDVLRLAVTLSDGDVSLAEPAKFIKFARRERKFLLSQLEKLNDPTEDMLRWKERWKRLGERLHPGDYSDKFPKAHEAFRVLRQDLDFTTFNRSIERDLQSSDSAAVLKLLETRPGDFARRLDHILRTTKSPRIVTDSFKSASQRVSTPVLLQVLAHFKYRGANNSGWRTFFPKGDVAKVYSIASRLPELPHDVIEGVVELCEQTLKSRFAQLSSLGRCYLDPALKNFLVLFSQRSASKSLRTVVRGSRLPMPELNVARFFVWWKNGRSRTDLDLSAVLYNDQYRYVDVLSYYNLKNYGGHHSGDIVDAPNGAAEFIDLDISRLKSLDVRYIVMSLNNYTEQAFCDLPECFAGWMGRKHANSGEIFEARTVQDKVDIAANTRICIPVILDLWERQVIWTDVALTKHMSWNNVNNNLRGVSLMLRAMSTLKKLDLHTLLSLHIQSRGEFVQNKDDADRVFSVHQGTTPFDIPVIASEFM